MVVCMPRGYVNIQVKPEAKEALEKVKAEQGFHSLSEAILFLYRLYLNVKKGAVAVGITDKLVLEKLDGISKMLNTILTLLQASTTPKQSNATAKKHEKGVARMRTSHGFCSTQT
jgi:hypothetical protein